MAAEYHLRKGLVVFQFVISVGLIVASVIINNQMQYMKNQRTWVLKRSADHYSAKKRYSKKYLYFIEGRGEEESADSQNVGASMFYPGIINPSDMAIL